MYFFFFPRAWFHLSHLSEFHKRLYRLVPARQEVAVLGNRRKSPHHLSLGNLTIGSWPLFRQKET